MARTKYKYNPNTLSYEEVQLSGKDKFLRVILLIAPSIILTTILLIIFSPKNQEEKLTEKEKETADAIRKAEMLESQLDDVIAVLEDVQKRDDEIYRIIFNAEKFPSNVREMGVGGSNRKKELETFDHSKLIQRAQDKLHYIERKLYAQSMSFDEVEKLAKEKENMLSSIPSIQPLSNKDLTRIASGFGWRVDPHYHTPRMHTGLDFTAVTGTDVYATGNGKVVEIKSKMWGYGNEVVIDHGYGFKSRYAHLNAFNVKLGQIVKRGEIIGFVGSTGKSTAPHLHYEIEKNGSKVDPANYFHSDLTPEAYEMMLEMSSNANQSFD